MRLWLCCAAAVAAQQTPPRRRLARRTRARESAAVGAAVRALAPAPANDGKCVFHLHTPKCAGTFVWRFFRDKFCTEAET